MTSPKTPLGSAAQRRASRAQQYLAISVSESAAKKQEATGKRHRTLNRVPAPKCVPSEATVRRAVFFGRLSPRVCLPSFRVNEQKRLE